MFKKNSFFKGYFMNSNTYNNNLKNTKKIFATLLVDLKNKRIPLIESYEKSYKLNFTKQKIKELKKYKNIIIIGMGGSIMGTKSIYSYLKDKIKKKVFFFDNLDLNIHKDFKKLKNQKNLCFIIISKSGNTLETITNLETIAPKLLFKNKLIIITELRSSKLLNIAKKFNAEIIEHNRLIGGRYAVLSEVGMFPAALMNLKISKFKNLNSLLRNKYFTTALINSVSSIYTLNQKGIKNSVILNYDPKLNDLCFWQQQLMAESLGKNGKGITPIVSQCPKDHHSLLQLFLDGPKDKFFTFLSSSVNKYNKIERVVSAQCKATKNIFRNKKIPFRHLSLKKNDEAELGSLFTFFVLETILLARLMKINPFDQPAVEDVKIETKKFLI
jgi:glucose-6-phosphate isomerase